MSTEPESSVFTFDTTHHAMWAEDVAREQAIAAEVIPAPPDGGAKCGAALRVSRRRKDELAAALGSQGIPYRMLEQ